jgi:hypothetical protein
MQPPAANVDPLPVAHSLLRARTREARTELARLRRIRGAGPRTARRIHRARRRLALLALAAGLLEAGGGEPAAANVPVFVNLLVPFGLSSVAGPASPTFADLDGDGDLDAFLGDNNGTLSFFENTGSVARPAFVPTASNPFGLVAVAARTAPAFADLDADGDLDALVGTADGNTLLFVNSGTETAPAFAPPLVDPFGLVDVGDASAPVAVDFDADGDLDIFVGRSDGNVLFFENTGAASAAAFAAPVTNAFLIGNVGDYAVPSFGDVDNDGDLDALIGAGSGETYLFQNTGSAGAPAFVVQNAISYGIPGVSSAASPELVDFDRDGDLDVFVGGDDGRTRLAASGASEASLRFIGPLELADVGSFASPAPADLDGDGDIDLYLGEYEGDLLLLENQGTPTFPSFLAPVAIPFGLAGGFYAAPAFADVDGDADLDALLGDVSGSVLFVANTGTATAPEFVAPTSNPFGLANVGMRAAPAFADLDDDGDLDGLVGEAAGGSHYFANTGDALVPAFAAPVVSPFGLPTLALAKPELADVDQDGDLDAWIGAEDGNVHFAENTGTASQPAFATPLVSPFGLDDVGLQSAPAFADIDGDGDLDAFVGAYFGGTIFFANLSAPCPPAGEVSCTEFLSGSLLVDERKPGKERIQARFAGGPALEQADFGDPTVADGTRLALCLYDGAGARVAQLVVDRAGESCGAKPCWKSLGTPPAGKGFAYKDAVGSADGMRALKLKAGSDGAPTLAASASNRAKKGERSLATGVAERLATSAEVRLELHTSHAACFGVTLSDVRKQESDRFKAR